uniref:Uncharacterized protein n=1 Tax=Rhizophora mucronata TaxID=61149 RepID=A0A2P2Q5X6_RHIMU
MLSDWLICQESLISFPYTHCHEHLNKRLTPYIGIHFAHQSKSSHVLFLNKCKETSIYSLRGTHGTLFNSEGGKQFQLQINSANSNFPH